MDKKCFCLRWRESLRMFFVVRAYTLSTEKDSLIIDGCYVMPLHTAFAILRNGVVLEIIGEKLFMFKNQNSNISVLMGQKINGRIEFYGD